MIEKDSTSHLVSLLLTPAITTTKVRAEAPDGILETSPDAESQRVRFAAVASPIRADNVTAAANGEVKHPPPPKTVT